MVGGGTLERIKRMHRMPVRLGLLVVLLFLVVPNLAQARPSMDETPVSAHEPSLVERAWSWMSSVFMKGGSFIDPAGIFHPTGTSSSGTEGGSFIDPNG